MYVQHDAVRGLPFATTTMHNELNQVVNYDRGDDFRRFNCQQILGYQTDCRLTYKMTPAQEVSRIFVLFFKLNDKLYYNISGC